MSIVLVAANVLVWAWGLVSGGPDELFARFGLFAGAATSAAGTLIGELGPAGSSASVDAGVGVGEWYRIFTSTFIHAGVLHLGMNMLFMWVVGRVVEEELGAVDFVLVYLASMVSGSAGALSFDPFAVTVGASGALYGLLGAALVLQKSRGIDPWSTGLGTLVVVNLVITFLVPQISIGGHLGGLLGGALAELLLIAGERVGLAWLGRAATLGMTFIGSWTAVSIAMFSVESGRALIGI